MTVKISHLAHVDPRAEFGENVEIGPFCCIGPDVTLGDGCELQCHVTIAGHTTIGERNRFFRRRRHRRRTARFRLQRRPDPPGNRPRKRLPRRGHRQPRRRKRRSHHPDRPPEPADGQFPCGTQLPREQPGHPGQRRACWAGTPMYTMGPSFPETSRVHHFCDGRHARLCQRRLARSPRHSAVHDGLGSDNPGVNTINLVGLRRAGISQESIAIIKRAHRLLYRDMKPLDTVRDRSSAEELDGIFPFELSTLLNFLEKQRRGKLGRAREIFATRSPPPGETLPAEGRMTRLAGRSRGGFGALGRHHARIYSQPRYDRADCRRRHRRPNGARPWPRRAAPAGSPISDSFSTGRRRLDCRADHGSSRRSPPNSSSAGSPRLSKSRSPRRSPKARRHRGGRRTDTARRCRSAMSSGLTRPSRKPAAWFVIATIHPGRALRVPTPFARPISASCST